MAHQLTQLATVTLPRRNGATSAPVPVELPERLVLVLRGARDAEALAVGAQRRDAWRTTRELLGGAISAGYPARLLASCLGVGLDSIRTRAERDAWVAGAAVVGVGDIRTRDLLSWRAAGLLPQQQVRDGGSRWYPAVDIVRALAAAPPDLASTTGRVARAARAEAAPALVPDHDLTADH